MKDISKLPDTRGVQIQRVGIKDLHVPLQIKKRDDGFQQVLANVNMSVDLPHRYRGTHLSRLIETLFQWSEKPLSGHDIRLMLEQTREKLQAERAHLTLKFKYFIPKKAPVSHSMSALDYEVEFTGNLEGDDFDFILGIEVPVTTLCPCSKAIARYGAHNQRAVIHARIRYKKDIFYWIEDLVEQLEGLASAQLYPMLKRLDEKYVTEQAYENPKFVEDLLRDVVVLFRTNEHIQWFQVECESFESIHNHNAYAFQEEWRPETR